MALDELRFFRKYGYFETPQYLQIEITDFCPLKCEQCYKKDADYVFLELKRFQQILGEAKDLGIEEIFFNGGEPLVHSNFWDMVKYCDQLKINSTVFTSGYGINEASMEYLKESRLKIQISLNGSTEEINRKSRDGYKIAKQAMEYLKQNDIQYGINWVARHDNVYDLPQLINLARECNACNINIVCNKMTGTGKVESSLSKTDYRFLKETVERYSDFCMIQSCYGILLSLMGAPHNKLYGCQAGIRLMAITAEGRYMPCTHLHYEEDFNDMKEYWIESSVLKKIRGIRQLEFCDRCNKCRVCHSISKESHDNLQIGFRDCPLME